MERESLIKQSQIIYPTQRDVCFVKNINFEYLEKGIERKISKELICFLIYKYEVCS